MRAISAGRVKTTWKYSTGSRSSARAAIQSRAAFAGLTRPHRGHGPGSPCSLRAVAVLARVVGDVPVAALRAGRHVPAERLRPAGLDRRHDLELGQADMPGMGPPPRGAVGAEDVGDLQPWPSHRGLDATPARSSASGPATASAARMGSRCRGSFWWRRGCSAPSSRAWRARAAPGSPARPSRLPAGASRSCGGACAATLAW